MLSRLRNSNYLKKFRRNMHVEMPLSFWIFVISFLTFRSRAQMETEPLVGEAILQVSSMEQRIKCNGTFRSISNVRGEIFSNITNVDGKMLYRPESNCQYVISAKGDRKVRVRFTNFDLENSALCQYDYVRIQDGMFGYSPFVGRYCGRNAPPVFESSGRNVHIEFKSDRHVEKGGFRLEFEFFETDPQSVRKDCVYHLTDPEAYVSSDFMYREFPLIPLFGIDCTWIIYRPPDTIGDSDIKMVLHFEQISLGFPNMCEMNRFETYSGLPSEDRLIEGRPHCTDFWSQDIETKDDKLYLHYVSRPGKTGVFKFWYTSARVASFCGPGEYECLSGTFCVNRTKNCQERFDKGQYCNTAFRKLQCFDQNDSARITQTSSLYLFAAIGGVLMAACGVVTMFWVSLTHKIANLRSKEAEAIMHMGNIAAEGLQNMLITLTGESDPDLTSGQGTDNPDQADDSGNTSKSSIKKLANQEKHYLPVIPVLARGPSPIGIIGSDNQTHLLGFPPLQTRKHSETVPWVERFHISDASGSNIAPPPGDFNRLLKYDDSRPPSHYRPSIFFG